MGKVVVVVVVVAEEKQADVVVVAVVEVVVVVVVVDGGQRWRVRHLPCTNDVPGLGAPPPPAVSFPPHFHCAGGVVVCSCALPWVLCLLKKTKNTHMSIYFFLVGCLILYLHCRSMFF